MKKMTGRNPTIENRTFDEMSIGDEATLHRVLSRDDILLFAAVSGDVNPAHVDEEFARSDFFQKIIAHGMWGAALISTVLGTEMPGPGTIYLGQTLRFKRPVAIGDHIVTTVRVTRKDSEKSRVTLECFCRNQRGEEVIRGEAEVMAPREKIIRPRKTLPEVKIVERFVRFQELIRLAEPQPPIRTAVVHPVDRATLANCIEAHGDHLIIPVLIGPAYKIKAVAEAEGLAIDAFEMIDVAHSHAAAEEAVRLAEEGLVELIMKGTLSSEELLGVLNGSMKLRTGRKRTHVHSLDVPTFPRTLFMTDTELNVTPDIETKTGIVQNAVDLLHALGRECPRVAILSAGDLVDLRMPSTMEAAALCKMAERNQIRGAMVDGPMPFDIAVSSEAGDSSNCHSAVVGNADILVVPDMEAGRILVQQLRRLIDASAAGIILGYRVPVILPGPADNVRTCEASCALACMWSHYHQEKDAIRIKTPKVRSTPLA
ncbi:MAG: bifunctional enoyl-CoA hydratase/phosphate acetyltransferase [Opitutaceae bacterium]